METWANNLFYIIFLGQIFLTSYYFPEKILARMRYVLATYPPSTHPRLYPKPAEYYKTGQATFRLANRIILVLGLVILFAIVFVVDHSSFADDGYISEAWPVVYGMIQFLPLVYLEFSEFNQFKLMRQTNSATSRKAELRPRRLFDFISPSLFGLAVILYLTAVGLDLYLHQFVMNWGQNLWLTGGMLFFAVIGGIKVYGRKSNPHQSNLDRARETTAALLSLTYLSITISIFYMFLSVDNVYNLDYLDAILMSVYFQAIVLLSIGQLLRNLKLKDINFDVYKDDAVAA